MNNVVIVKYWLHVGSHAGGLEATTLIYADINDHRVGFHAAYHFLRYHAGTQTFFCPHGPDHYVGAGNSLGQRIGIDDGGIKILAH